MAELILTSIADGIIGQLRNAAVKEFALLWAIEEELQQLQDTVSTTNGTLAYVEKQQLTDDQVRAWLQRLEDLVYGADDLVDEFSTETLRRQVMVGKTELAKEVRSFFSSSNQLVFRHKIGRQIEGIRKKLDGAANDRKFHLETGPRESNKVVAGEWLETHSFVLKEEVMGRDDDKMAILKLVLDTKTEEKVGVIPIVGVGGLGKTTLTKLVFNDEMVQEQFELIMWVCT